jgi:hypothetical protein
VRDPQEEETPMAFIICPECQRGISEKAIACPHCGYPLSEPPPPVEVIVDGRSRKRGWGFEWRSKAQLLGLPLVHVAIGRDPKTLKMRVAKGIVAIGQFGFGFITIAQVGVGLVFGFGQAVAGLVAIGQLALGVQFGLGQLATGATAIGQFAFGTYVLAQLGAGTHVWSAKVRDPQAVEHFTALWSAVKGLWGG